MGAFDAFIENDSDISAWIKWIHIGVPDEENDKRDEIRKEMAIVDHCKPCTALSGCYFVTSRMPGHLPPDMLHPRCDCTYKFIHDAQRQIKATCDIRKFNEYLFTEDQIKKGKTKPYFDLGFDINDSEYLANEYARQAKEKYAMGEYRLQLLNEYGQRINIELTLRNGGKTITVISGWLVHPLGYISATTPYLGYGNRI